MPNFVAGYMYRAELFHPECLVEQMIDQRELSPAARDMEPETVLDQHAAANGIDRTDETTFDSGEFPKVVLTDYVEPYDTCGYCANHMMLDPNHDRFTKVWADGYGLWHASVRMCGTPQGDAARARRAIRAELEARAPRGAVVTFHVTRERVTNHGTVVYVEVTR